MRRCNVDIAIVVIYKKTMKKIIYISLLMSMTVCLSFLLAESPSDNQSVNAVIGDISFTEKFGHLPDEKTNEDLRIKTHLEYVKNMLRNTASITLTAVQQQRREHLLLLLHQYTEAGVFPKNYDYEDCRKPCFIDKDGRICAVGYLIEKTAGRAVSETIKNRHKYDELLAMNDKLVDEWIASSGLSMEECAMIQPSYGSFPPQTSEVNSITRAEGISSSILGGANLSLNTINILQSVKGTANKTTLMLGLVAGAGQTILGIAMFPKNTTDYYGNVTPDNEKKTLSMVNIGLGTSTLFFSALNLILNKGAKNNKTTWNINSFETANNSLGMAFSFKQRL